MKFRRIRASQAIKHFHPRAHDKPQKFAIPPSQLAVSELALLDFFFFFLLSDRGKPEPGV